MKSKISRRSFLRNIAAAGSGAAALGLLAGCSSSSTAASSGSTAAAEDKYPGHLFCLQDHLLLRDRCLHDL